jgi:hypothetical protein
LKGVNFVAMAEILDGKAVSDFFKQEIAKEVLAITAAGNIPPH